MNKVYVLNFNESGIYCAYASEDTAKKVLWECYCDELLPALPEMNRDIYYAADLKTWEEDGCIIGYGWVEEVTFVNE